MSLTNPNTPVSQQDLKDFYDKIKPYMGIVPPAIANKFSKGDIYSTDEKMIGQWIDGKPLYQKTVTYTLSGAISDDDFTIPVSLTDLETVVMVYGTLYSGANIGIPLVTSAQAMKQYGSQLGIISIGVVTDSSIQIRCPKQALSSGDKVNVTVQYTKTTDTAISIGSDTDYSTDEKIVGTWIDGSPVYQKTFKFKLTALKTEISIGASVEDAFVTYGYVNNGAGYLLPKALYLSGDMYINSGVHKSNNTVYIETNINELIGKDCVLVVQYTKTT